ncbi:MAG TPA: hypothetical protein VN522_12875 [Solirubrobacterales bacterium]|nr:hypothetical protein [Solirubrobacterales bacterium]
MSMKRVGLAALIVTALFAVFAGNALGATKLTTKKAVWSNSGVPFGSSEATGKTPVCSAATSIVFKGTILASEYEMTATGLSCTGKLWNEGSGESEMAVGKGPLTFTGITINKPAGCKLNGEANGSAKLTTETLQVVVDMHGTNAEPSVETPIPVVIISPVGEKIATIHVTNCAVEGSYKVIGGTVGEGTTGTGGSAVNHPVIFSTATNEAGSLTLAGHPATVTGKANNELVGGEAFQVN